MINDYKKKIFLNADCQLPSVILIHTIFATDGWTEVQFAIHKRYIENWIKNKPDFYIDTLKSLIP